MNEKLAEYVGDHKKALEKSNGEDDDGKQFPRAACVIDVLRNSVAFDTAGQILAAFDALTQHEGLQLVRYKNKYHADSLWNGAPPPFRNLMVNVLFTYPPGEADPAKRFPIVGELQLTTLASVKLKKVQHKVYELLRAWEGGRDSKQAYQAILNSVCKLE